MSVFKHKTLDFDEAEEQFKQRNLVMNQFALKAQIQQQIKNKDDLEIGLSARSLVKNLISYIVFLENKR